MLDPYDQQAFSHQGDPSTSPFEEVSKSTAPIKIIACQTPVQALLVLTLTLWDPHTQTDINKIQVIQTRSARCHL